MFSDLRGYAGAAFDILRERAGPLLGDLRDIGGRIRSADIGGKVRSAYGRGLGGIASGMEAFTPAMRSRTWGAVRNVGMGAGAGAGIGLMSDWAGFTDNGFGTGMMLGAGYGLTSAGTAGMIRRLGASSKVARGLRSGRGIVTNAAIGYGAGSMSDSFGITNNMSGWGLMMGAGYGGIKMMGGTGLNYNKIVGKIRGAASKYSGATHTA